MRRLVAVFLAVGALAAAVVPGTALAAKAPAKSLGSCGVSETSNRPHVGLFFNGIGSGNGFNLQTCEPANPNP